jgi:hypothetical protein
MPSSSEATRQPSIGSNIIKPDKIGLYLEKHEFPLWVALNHHRTHTNKQMTLKNHFYLKDILTDKSRYRVYKKSTQGGVSECLIVISWSAAYQGKVIFYVLPTHQLMERFVSNRFEKSMAFSPYYREQRTTGRSKDLSRQAIDNRSLKDIGSGVINFAGSGSDVPFVEIPADWLIVDEADQCDPKRLEMGKERLGHSSDPHEIYVGNPTFVGSFLDSKFEESTKSRWNIKADCGHWIQIDFFKHVVDKIDESLFVLRDKDFDIESGIDARPICDVCGKPFDRFGRGEYVEEKKSHISGKQISRLFSGASPLIDLVSNFSSGLSNDYKMQRFYNSDLGESYTSAGARITPESLDDIVRDYTMPESSRGPCVAGIDVGSLLHIHICEVLQDGLLRTVFIGEVEGGYDEVIELFRRYHVAFFVIDSMPETRLSRKLVSNWPGCDCNVNATQREFNFNKQTRTVSQIRTAFLDNVKESVLLTKFILPRNARTIPNYYDQMTASVRVWDPDKERFNWEHGTLPDHFMFATGYMLLAKRLFVLL